jgi:hypothetical protein
MDGNGQIRASIVLPVEQLNKLLSRENGTESLP